MTRKYDVVIVGAALNGLAVALALGGLNAKRGLSVAVVDIADPAKKAANATDARASALTRSSQSMFEALGAWEYLRPYAQDMREIIVTDGNGPTVEKPVLLQFGDVSDTQSPTASMVENHVLLGALLKTVAQSPHIQLLTGHAVVEQSFTPGLAKLTLADGTRLSANLLVAADGAKSPLRQVAGIELVGWSYEQMGLVASFDHDLPHGGRAEEHFSASGVFAVLPLTGNRSSIVWTKDKTDAQRMIALSPSDFERELQVQVGDHLGKITLIGKQQGYPLSMLVAKDFHGTRLALVGDAAHVIHPLAGLGLNLGLRDASALAECVADAFALGQDIGGPYVLERYSAWRRFDTVATAAAMDAMNKLFANNNPMLRIVRDFGLQATNKISVLKNAFEREAAGQTGDLPKLLRGEAV
jgi:2-octaprenyl-6-methoxyphenol hydroxylase